MSAGVSDVVTMVPFDLTYVRYEKGDLVGLLLAVVTLTPVFVMVMYATIILTRRDFQTCFICLGQLINVAINLVLKKIISQPRPEDSGFSDGGMPSNHSQFVCFFSVLYILQIWRVRKEILITPFKILYSLALVALAFGVCFSRFYLHYHFADQIYVGAVAGTFAGAIWHRLYVQFCVSHNETTRSCNLSELVCSHPLMKGIGLRDYSRVEYAPMEEQRAMQSMYSAKKTR